MPLHRGSAKALTLQRLPSRALANAMQEFVKSRWMPGDAAQHVDRRSLRIAMGPELIMPSEWLPMIWGDDEPVFTDEAQMQAVLGGILSRYNQIRHQIANGTFEPILWSDADGTVIGTEWAEGFMQGCQPARYKMGAIVQI